MENSSQQRELLYAKLNLETSQMPWHELERYFASGSIITVHDELDMIDVAVLIASDDTEAVSALLQKKHIERTTDLQAQAWQESEADLWTVVVKPWILVQHQKVV